MTNKTKRLGAFMEASRRLNKMSIPLLRMKFQYKSGSLLVFFV